MQELSWMILTIGHLSMNKFWGEKERKRSALCTSTLIRSPEGLVLVDPPMPPDRMAALLADQAGVTPDDVKHVFLTHFHGDHRYGLEALERAAWWMGAPEIEHVKKQEGELGLDRALFARVLPAGAELLPGVKVLHTPGHTPGTSSLLFEWRGWCVAVTGDAVMTEAHFRAREGHHNSVDAAQASESVGKLAAEADIVIPGHGGAFITALKPEPGGAWWGGPA
jgi:glyoxylase-like metal-dependent hydrolase (beta-lactamase superfamily II)